MPATRRRSKDPRASQAKSVAQHLPARYLYFGGKGGVGKTTAAAATGLFLLKKAAKNQSILLFSTDPAHSLSDSLSTDIGNRLVEVKRYKGARLFAYEMDASLALDRFRKQHEKTLATIAERGTLLDESDIKELLHLSLPGLDEVMSLFELTELDRSEDYLHIVVDTAPSGHTSRLLRLPEVFSRMVNALDHMSDKHRYLVTHFARRRMPDDDVELFLRDLRERIDRVSRMLYDTSQAQFTLVTIPEAMSVQETNRYYSLLKEQGVPVRDLIVNRVEATHKSCLYCESRMLTQQPWLKVIQREFKSLQIHQVPLMPAEVRGLDALGKLGELIWQSSSTRTARTKTRKAKRTKSGPPHESDFKLDRRRIVLFGGKGGVGKTSAAAAFALALARSESDKRILIFSTDPAHSLSDSFNEKIGALKKGVGKTANLDAMEIDPGAWFEDLKIRYRNWTDSLFTSLTGESKLEIKFDREAMRELVELTPPGIDEIAALGTVSDLIEEDRYDTIVLDTAPTGHLLRFLELPKVALAWIRTFIKLLLKYQNVVRATDVAEELVALSKNLKRVLALLTDPKLCEFVGVAIPERMSLEETRDLSQALSRLEVPMTRLLINGVVPAAAAVGCEFCSARRKLQEKSIREFAKQFEANEMYIAEQHPDEIRGKQALINHFAGWKKL